ncbi:sulfotransferase [Novosphingobium sp.]|uniref:tetratricopeptide repeat-containing sulfotransferase family protein n=1 Tax=Novosphingobium sp. TaxID=1874826 RepID=UPI003BAC9C65
MDIASQAASKPGIAPGSDARAALDEAAAGIDADPQGALAVAEAVLATAPGLPPALFVAGQALRRLGKPDAALARLAAIGGGAKQPPMVLWELAQAASEAGRADAAIAALEALTRLQPGVASGWFLLAAELRKSGHEMDAWRADLSAVHAASRDPDLLQAAGAIHAGQLDDAEAMLQARAERLPDDPVGTRMLGEVYWRRGDMADALAFVERAVALAPGFDLARDFLVRLLMQVNRLPDALAHAEVLAQSPVANSGADLILASVLVRLGEQERARGIYERMLKAQPEQPLLWQNLGHVLKTLGEQDGAVAAYRAAVTHQPSMGEAWWSLANLKTVKLGGDDIARMEAALAELAGVEGREEDVFHLHFSLGKAYEDVGDAARAFVHYDKGNRLRRTLVRYDAEEFAAEVDAAASTFTAPFIAAMGEGSCPAEDPIFIVGLPRSGSTLVEQILSSHSAIEGTMELSEMMMIAARLQSRVDEGEFADFAAMVRSLGPAERLRLGEEYIERTRVHRKTDRPRFTDKMPNNWQHVGLIRLILPNAKIVDARRHPMSCCFSGWKQHFARGQTFTYDLGEIGRYYRDYMRLMAHYDAAAPGAVHRVIYERMVADQEGETRRLLDYLGLPFEESCLEFHRNTRAVRTASSEQVRRPIYTDAVEHWKAFASWLGPLEAALGDATTSYPDVPSALLS